MSRKPHEVRDDFLSWFPDVGAKLLKKDFTPEEVSTYEDEMGYWDVFSTVSMLYNVI